MSIPSQASMRWRKSSHSDSSGGDCVEVAPLSETIAMRDSKNPDTALTVGRAAFGALARGLKSEDLS